MRSPCILARACLGATIAVSSIGAAYAASATFRYTDQFDSADALYAAGGSPTPFAGPTPFSVTAVFDTSAPSFVFPAPGFRAYTPASAFLAVGGTTYRLLDADIAIFDPTNVFNPGRFAAGFIKDPAIDGSGFVADFNTAAPPFVVANLVSTVFQGYNGTGWSAGPGTPTGCIPGVSCTGQDIVPIHLEDSAGNLFYLQLGNRNTGPEVDPDDTHVATVQIQVVPEPGTLGMGGLAIGLLLWARRSR